jgi:hypothetical protein
LIFERVTDIEKHFAGNGNDGSLIERQLLSRAGVKRESCTRPTKNRVANLSPLRFRWYFNNNAPRLVASRILEANVKIAVRFDFRSNYAPRERVPVILNPGAL